MTTRVLKIWRLTVMVYITWDLPSRISGDAGMSNIYYRVVLGTECCSDVTEEPIEYK